MVKICSDCHKEVIGLIQGRCEPCYGIFRRSGNFTRKFADMPATLTDYQNEVLDGLMLGDGCLFLETNRYANGNPRLSIMRASQDHDYLVWNYEVFKDFCSMEPIAEDYIGVGGTPLKRTRFVTRKSPAFMEQRQRWYPNGKKAVPKDLVLTPLVISIWIADDGHVSKYNTNTRQPRLHTTFNSQSFTKEDNEFLIDLLSKRYNNQVFSLGMQRDKYVITAADAACRMMYRDIDPVFPPSMTRKAIWLDDDIRVWEDIPPVRYPRIEGKASENRIKALASVMQKVKHATPSELAWMLDWTYTSRYGVIMPDIGSVNRYLKKAVDMKLITRDDTRDHHAHKGFVYHWIEQEQPKEQDQQQTQ